MVRYLGHGTVFLKMAINDVVIKEAPTKDVVRWTAVYSNMMKACQQVGLRGRAKTDEEWKARFTTIKNKLNAMSNATLPSSVTAADEQQMPMSKDEFRCKSKCITIITIINKPIFTQYEGKSYAWCMHSLGSCILCIITLLYACAAYMTNDLRISM